MRSASKKLGKFLGNGRGKLSQRTEHSARAIYSQVQMVTRVESLAGEKLGKQEPHPQVTSPPLDSPPWRKHLDLSSISAPGPKEQQTRWVTPGPTAMTKTPCPATDQ